MLQAWKGIKAGISLILLAMFLTACGNSPATTVKDKLDFPEDGSPAKGSVTQFYTKNVMYRIDEDIVVGLPDMDADMLVKRPNQPLIPGNLDDFVINVHSGHFVIDDKSMSAIFNKFAFGYEGSPLSDLKVTSLDGRVSLTGTLHKGLPIPFAMEGTLAPNGQGQLVLHPEVMKSAGIPVKGIMDVLGMEMANLINSRSAGVKIDGNKIIIYPDKLLPPPTIKGFAVAAQVQPGRTIMVFDDKVRRPYPEVPEAAAKNYLLMWGGNVLINNHLILNAKVQEIDDTPQDPMWVYLPLYREQLQAGYVVADHGLTIAYIPDIKGTTYNPTRYRPKLASVGN